MTSPDERYRAVQMAGQFLKDISTRPNMNKDIVARATSILRHYPSTYDLHRAALEMPHFFSEEAESEG
jgi:hypothetical protein